MSILTEGQVVNELPFPPLFFGLGAIAAFAVLLVITFAFRSVHTRHSPTSRPGSSGH